MADRHQIKKLKEWGFKTFHPFIDESYDDVLDKDKRQEMIFKQIEIKNLHNRCRQQYAPVANLIKIQ